MTIEDAIKNIKEPIDTYIVCHGEEDTIAVSIDNVDVEAFDVAIDTMLKYQKIQKIVTHYRDNVRDKVTNENMEKILEVVEHE